MVDTELNNKITRLESKCEEVVKDLANTIKEVNRLKEKLNEKNANDKVIETQLENIIDTIQEIKNDVKSLKEKPSKNWEGLTTTIITAIASGIIAYVLFKLGVGG